MGLHRSVISACRWSEVRVRVKFFCRGFLDNKGVGFSTVKVLVSPLFLNCDFLLFYCWKNEVKEAREDCMGLVAVDRVIVMSVGSDFFLSPLGG